MSVVAGNGPRRLSPFRGSTCLRRRGIPETVSMKARCGSDAWSVSRVLYGLAVARKTWRPFIWDSTCALPLATHPDDRPGNRLASSAASSLFGFAPGEVYRAAMRCRRRGGLLPHPFTLTLPKGGAVCFLWHCLWGRPRRTFSGTVFPWSPDFPHPAAFRHWQSAAARPTGRAFLTETRANSQLFQIR